MSGLQVGRIKDFALRIYDGPHATPREADDGPIFLGIKNVDRLLALAVFGGVWVAEWYALKNHFFKEDMMGGGAIFAAITKKDLHGVSLLCPTDNLIKTFIEHVWPIDSQIENLHRLNNRLAKACDILLPRLMSGTVTV